MHTTSLTLLGRLQQSPTDVDWKRLYDLYRPLIRHWIARVPGVQAADADDIEQTVLTAVVKDIPTFDRRHHGAFRGWLRAITANRLRECLRRRRRGAAGGEADAFLDQLADETSDLAAAWEADHARWVVHKASERVRGDFEPHTWAIFRAAAVDGRPTAEVMAEFGVSRAVVLQARSRVLARLREEVGDLLG